MRFKDSTITASLLTSGDQWLPWLHCKINYAYAAHLSIFVASIVVEPWQLDLVNDVTAKISPRGLRGTKEYARSLFWPDVVDMKIRLCLSCDLSSFYFECFMLLLQAYSTVCVPLFFAVVSLGCCGLAVSTSANEKPKELVSEITYNV